MGIVPLNSLFSGAFLRNSVGSSCIALSLLASVFVGGQPLCLIGGVGFLLFSVIKWQTWFEYTLLLCAVMSVILFGLISVNLPTNLPILEVMKATLGVFLFFATLIIAPRALLMPTGRQETVLGVMALVISFAFLAEFFGVLSLKEMGVVSWFKTNAFENQIDTRPSGLFSEPSWHSLAGTALAFYLAKSKSLFLKVMSVVLCVTCIMSGSSIGLALTLPVLYRLIVINTRGGVPKVFLVLCAAIVALFAIAMPPEGSDFQNNTQIQKILDPSAFGSGRSRFDSPLQDIDDTLTQSPIFGMGLSYITERLIGITGAAVLPFNVFIQLGFFGVFIYFSLLMFMIIKYKSKLIDVICVIACIFSLGLEGSPFQAILLVFFICPYPSKRPFLRERKIVG